MVNIRGVQFAVAIAVLGAGCHYLWLIFRPNPAAHHSTPLFCESGERPPIYFVFAPGLLLCSVLLYLASSDAASAYEAALGLRAFSVALRSFAACAALGLAGMGMVTHEMSPRLHDAATYIFLGGLAPTLLFSLGASIGMQGFLATSAVNLTLVATRVLLIVLASRKAFQFLNKYGQAMAMVGQADRCKKEASNAVHRKLMKQLLLDSAFAQYTALASVAASMIFLWP